MPKVKRDVATEVDTLIDRGFYLQQEAIELAKQLDKIPFAERPITEPVRKATMLLSIAGQLTNLGRAILQKAALEEQRGEIERTISARVAGEEAKS